MRGREIDISLSDMKDWTPLERMNITVRQSRQSGVARATCPD